MTLDSRFRNAVAETVQAPRDLDARLGDLRRTRRSRAVQQGVVLGTVAVVAAAGFVLQRHQPTIPQPAPQPTQLRGGAALGLSQGGSVIQVAGPALPHRPDTALTSGPFSFTHDGASLVYAVDGGVHRLDLRTGTDDVIGDCPDSTCAIAVNEDATLSAVADGTDIVVTDLASGRADRLTIGAPPARLSWSPQSGLIAYTTTRGGRATLETVERESGTVTRLVRLPEAGDRFVSAPTWGNGGHQIAFVVHFARPGTSGLLELMTVTVIGTPLVTEVHEVDRCVCSDYAPGIAWSPDDNQIALTAPGRRSNGTAGSVKIVVRDGSRWRTVTTGSFTGALAWQAYVIQP
jgi:hypothetical protein